MPNHYKQSVKISKILIVKENPNHYKQSVKMNLFHLFISKTRVLCTTLDSAGQSHRAHREGSLCTALYSTPYKAAQRGTVHKVSWTTL
jgi:hypothetical protein